MIPIQSDGFGFEGNHLANLYTLAQYFFLRFIQDQNAVGSQSNRRNM